MMFRKADIRRVSIAVPGSDYRELIVSLGKSGLMQIDRDITDELQADGRAFLSADPAAAQGVVALAAEFLAENMPIDGIKTDYESVLEDVNALFSRDAASDLHAAESIRKKQDQYKKVRSLIEDQIAAAELKAAEIGILIKSGIDPAALMSLKHISFIYGTISSGDWLSNMQENWFYIKNSDRLLVIVQTEEKSKALNVLKENGFEELNCIMKPGYSLEESETDEVRRISDLNRRLSRLDEYYHHELENWCRKMSFLNDFYSVILKIAGAEAVLGFSHEITVINGWIDLRDADSLNMLLRRSCGDRFYIKIASRQENRMYRGRIPVLLKNSRLFRPFELLVKMMGFPGNSEVDPTPAAAIAYVIIFGVMFGDAGQGLVIALTGYMLQRYGFKKNGERNSISDFGSIMIWCGFSAVIFGFLYGSVFSNEHILPAILFHPMENMMKLFLMAIMMGVVIISSGLMLNIINGIISGHYGESLFGTKGAAGLTVYISFIYFALRYISGGILPSAFEFSASAGIPAILFFARGPLEYFLFRGERLFPHGLFEYLVESVIEIIEMFSGFLGNTISFIRAGAFALSHAGLSIAVFTLAGITDPAMTGAAAVSVVVLGNIFIIALEGLVCAIQSMRLEYYEFFGKFFQGNGAGFTPFSLKLNR